MKKRTINFDIELIFKLTGSEYVDIALYDETGQLNKQYFSLIKSLIIKTSKEIKLDTNFEVSVVIVDNKKIKEINKNYRNIDKVTDVISFAMEDNIDEKFESIFESSLENIEDEIPKLLGDIFISLEQAEKQAKEYGHSLLREIGFLTVHGFLHLNGYNHQTEIEKKEMFDLQNKILEESSLER